MLIDFCHADPDDKEKQRKIIKEKCGEISSKVTNLSSEIDGELGKPIKQNTPINIYSLLN